MALYQLRYRGEGEKPSQDIARVRAMPGVTVVNDNLKFSLILRVESDLAVHQLKKLAGWDLYMSHKVAALRDPTWDVSAAKAPPHLRLVPPPAKN